MENKSNNALIGSIVIVIIIVIGGIYLWKTSIKKQDSMPASQNSQVNQAESQSTDASNIEKDLNNVDVNNLDQGL